MSDEPSILDKNGTSVKGTWPQIRACSQVRAYSNVPFSSLSSPSPQCEEGMLL